jgi:helix-turn-helix protein/uncharacterized protein DUF4115
MPEQESQPQAGSSELASFGEELRREREIRGISLKEIADATKISKRFLEAIERNDHRTLPAPVFTRGFVREYARYVGLNAEEMVNRYNFAAANDDRIEKPPQVEKYATVPPRDITPKPKPKRGIPAPYARVNRNAISLFVLVALLAGVAWWAVQRKSHFLDAEAPPVVPVTTKAIARPVITPRIPVVDDSVLRLSVEVIGDSWVSLEADGKSVLNDELKIGDKRTFEANNEFKFRTIGNAAGLTLMLNGTRIPSLGKDGDVIKNRTFNRDSLRELRNEPASPGTAAPTT